jgi:predicted dehydrogenase
LQKIGGVRMVACMDVDVARAEGLAAWTGCKPHTEIGPVLDAADAIWVCTPPSFHREQVIACLDAGKHVYCEKPLAGQLDDALAVTQRAEESDLLAAIGFNQRFREPWQKCREILDSGELGQPLLGVVQRLDGPPGPGWRLDPELMVGMGLTTASAPA